MLNLTGTYSYTLALRDEAHEHSLKAAVPSDEVLVEILADVSFPCFSKCVSMCQ